MIRITTNTTTTTKPTINIQKWNINWSIQYTTVFVCLPLCLPAVRVAFDRSWFSFHFAVFKFFCVCLDFSLRNFQSRQRNCVYILAIIFDWYVRLSKSYQYKQRKKGFIRNFGAEEFQEIFNELKNKYLILWHFE